MPKLEDETREALRRLSVPPERPRFFEELRVRLQEHDRAAARRWRLTAIGAAAIAVVAVAAASVLAASSGGPSTSGKTTVVDRTISCQVAPTRQVYVDAWVTRHVGAEQNNPARDLPALVGVATWPRYAKPNDTRSAIVGQFGFNAANKGLVVDGVRCRTSHERVPLRPGDLPANGTATASFKGGIGQLCPAAGRVLVHYRVNQTGGIPQRAQVAIRDDDKRLTPLAYIDWTPKRVTTFTPNSCSTYPYVAVP